MMYYASFFIFLEQDTQIALLEELVEATRRYDCCNRDTNAVATAGPLVYPHNKLQSQITESNSFGVFARNVAISAPREGVLGPGVSTKREGVVEKMEKVGPRLCSSGVWRDSRTGGREEVEEEG
ncbi:hypothetical protein HZH66_014856 [Vespula vulgaris]|uniref:Uncharacterized protein n=1 Tax=Vespula vulgaris TaxID=7454 RepID=A0A834MNH0_VESVU|nr:hypothetical protein HZH66_014856 [Vespula vulgaris]